MIDFVCYGNPKSKGSTKSFAFVRKGATVAVSGGRVKGVSTATTSMTKGLKEWEHAVATEARLALANALQSRAPGARVLDEPVYLEMLFAMPRPKRLKALRNVPCDTTPDASKLWRAVEDALIGVLMSDDKLVTRWWGNKRFANPEEAPHVRVRIGPMSEVIGNDAVLIAEERR